MNILRRLKAPCARCPYKLGLVRTLVNPCPQCRADGYAMFEQFRRRYATPPPREKA
ncbi:MAG: hypothetical protein IKR84_01200 [Oscillibacter sp.]|nr:hypothetical protein [Oscillibacter sp.]